MLILCERANINILRSYTVEPELMVITVLYDHCILATLYIHYVWVFT